MTLQRVDFELAKASGSADGYAQYVSSLTFSSHWCYWESRDIMLFVLETLDRQRLAHDFFDTDTGRSWLSRAEHLLAHLQQLRRPRPRLRNHHLSRHAVVPPLRGSKKGERVATH